MPQPSSEAANEIRGRHRRDHPEHPTEIGKEIPIINLGRNEKVVERKQENRNCRYILGIKIGRSDNRRRGILQD